MRSVSWLVKRFHGLYQRALSDGTLRTDIPENKMFSCVLHIMLAAVTRYAVGLVYYIQDPGKDPVDELIMLKDMFLDKYVKRTEV